jgi:hypothetical protein
MVLNVGALSNGPCMWWGGGFILGVKPFFHRCQGVPPLILVGREGLVQSGSVMGGQERYRRLPKALPDTADPLFEEGHANQTNSYVEKSVFVFFVHDHGTWLK